MTPTMTPDQARQAVRDAVWKIVPDADFATLDPDADLRVEFELDSMDFLTFVDLLAKRSGRPISEDEYYRLNSMAKCVNFLVGPTT